MFATMIRRGGGLFALGLLLLTGGCGGGDLKTYPVKGKVTFRNKAVPHGTITFISASGQAATGEIQSDGSYELKTNRQPGAVAGEHKVIIVAMQDTTSALPEARSPTPPPIIPEKYTSLATTDLTATVKPEPNVIDFPLKEVKK